MKFRIAMTLLVLVIGLLGYLAFGRDVPSSHSRSSASSSTQNDSFKNFKMP